MSKTSTISPTTKTNGHGNESQLFPGQIHAKLHELAGKAGRVILERLRLVDALLQDRAYIADTYVDESRALDALEELYFADLSGSRGLAQLMTMYRAFPDEKTWGECKWNLTLLLGKYDAEHPPKKEPRIERHVVKLAEHEKVKQELAEQKYHRRQDQEEVAALRKQVAKLEAENAELRGRLAEMERLMDRQLVRAG